MSKTTNWNPEDPELWEQEGKRIAYRNLSISVPSLLCAFAVWMFWSILTVQMKRVGFPFSDPQLFTLIAVAGLTGATLRIPSSFLVGLAGGRNVVAVTTGLLIIPAVGAGSAVQNLSTPFSTFVILAGLSGIGGGNFASSMSNISFFFPKRMAGTALGVNAGVGNLGVSLMQVLMPILVTVPLFGVAKELIPMRTTVVGGHQIWIQNGPLVWVPVLGALALGAWFAMDNLPGQDSNNTFLAVLKILGLHLLGFAGAAVGLLLLLHFKLSQWLVLPLTIFITLGMLKALPGRVKTGLDSQFLIFNKQDNWLMTVLYLMSFGSFIGFSSALPLLISVVFGKLPNGQLNPNLPNPLAYAWIGPLVGSIIRPVGGWLSDLFQGSKVTLWATVLMILGALGVAHFIRMAMGSSTPEVFFPAFLALFLLLFLASGIANGSTFQMVPMLFEPKLAGPVLGWISAVAAYGAFIVPSVFKAQVAKGTPQMAFYGFAIYYLACFILAWWFYARAGSALSRKLSETKPPAN